MRCDLQAAGTIELYFYGELPQGGRVAVQAHLNGCAECRAALEDLSVIRRALAAGPTWRHRRAATGLDSCGRYECGGRGGAVTG